MLHRIAVVLAAGLALIACSAGDDAGPEGLDRETPTLTPTITATTTSEPEEATTLSQILDAYERAAFAVTFDVDQSMGDETVKGTMTWYLKRPNSRLDVSLMALGQEVDEIYIALDDATFVCSHDGGDHCLQLLRTLSIRQQANQVTSLVDNFVQYARGEGAELIEPADGQVIADQQVSCFHFVVTEHKADGNDVDVDWVLCFSRDGIPVLIESHGSFDREWRGTSTRSATDADFEPPYPVETMPYD